MLPHLLLLLAVAGLLHGQHHHGHGHGRDRQGQKESTANHPGTFYMEKDWPYQEFNVTEYVTFGFRVPQLLNPTYNDFDVKIALFGTKVPNTVANFGQLAAGGIIAVMNDSSGEEERRELKYKGTPLHRLEKDVSIQGGDVVFKDGTGSVTRFNASAILPENYWLSNYGKGWVGMVHNGAAADYSTGCQFYICMTNDRQILHALNLQRYVVIGKVVSGMKYLNVLNSQIGRKIKLDETIVPETGYPLNRPLKDIIISRSKYEAVPAHRLGKETESNRPSDGELTGKWPRPPPPKEEEED